MIICSILSKIKEYFDEKYKRNHVGNILSTEYIGSDPDPCNSDSSNFVGNELQDNSLYLQSHGKSSKWKSAVLIAFLFTLLSVVGWLYRRKHNRRASDIEYEGIRGPSESFNDHSQVKSTVGELHQRLSSVDVHLCNSQYCTQCKNPPSIRWKVVQTTS